MIGGTFFNREPELALFERELASTPPAQNRIVFLVAPSGYGKSEFADKVIGQQRNAVGIKIRVPANIEGNAPFIHALAREIDRVARSNGVLVTGNDFLSALLSDGAKRSHDSALLRDVAESVKLLAPIVRIRDRVTNTGPFDFARMLQETERESTVALFEYVRYVFGHTRLCVGIENVQAIDPTSQTMLVEALALQRGHFIILEYTHGLGTASQPWSDFARMLRDRGNEVKAVALERLPLYELLVRLDFRLDAETLKELFTDFDGNLRRLEDLIVLRAHSPESTTPSADLRYAEATTERVRRLSPTAQFVLALVVTHRSSASRESLRSMYEHSRYFAEHHGDIETAIEELVNNDLLREVRGTFSVAHDSIAAEVTEHFSKYRELAYRAWASHYRSKLERKDFGDTSKDRVLDFLFSFYVKTDPSRLQPLLGEVRHTALMSITTDRAAAILAAVDASLDGYQGDAEYEQVIRWELLKTYYDAGLWRAAFRCLEHIRTKPNRATAFRAAILDRLDYHDDAIALVRATLATRAPRHDSFELSLRLIEMICLRSLNEYDECTRVYHDIRRIRAYDGLPEYAYFLRNAEIIESIVDSIPLLEESVRRLQVAGNAPAEAQSLISLGMQLTRLGRLDESEHAFDRAAELLVERRLEWHVLHNDRAVLTMRRPQWDLDTVDGMLRNAMMTANIGFDRVAIKNNRLIAHALAADFGFCEGVARDLEQTATDGADDALLCATYFNLSVYRGLRRQTAEAARFLAMARACNNDWPEYWANRFDGVPITTDPAAAYQATFPFDVVMLSAWHIDISDFGER